MFCTLSVPSFSETSGVGGSRSTLLCLSQPSELLFCRITFLQISFSRVLGTSGKEIKSSKGREGGWLMLRESCRPLWFTIPWRMQLEKSQGFILFMAFGLLFWPVFTGGWWETGNVSHFWLNTASINTTKWILSHFSFYKRVSSSIQALDEISFKFCGKSRVFSFLLEFILSFREVSIQS